MKKTLLKICFVVMILPLTIIAQSNVNQEFNDQLLEIVKNNADIEAKARVALIGSKYDLDGITYKSLFDLFYDSKVELEMALIQVKPSDNKQVEIEKIILKNENEIRRFLSALRGKNLFKNKTIDPDDKSKFASAVRIREKLNLNDSQIENLINQANLMAEMKIENSGLDLKAYERKILPNILTDEQYTSLLIYLNSKKASAWAKETWKELKDRGIDEGLDETQVYNQVFNYNLGKLVYFERFANDEATSSASINQLRTEKPEALQRLEFDKARNAKEKSKTTKAKFAW